MPKYSKEAGRETDQFTFIRALSNIQTDIKAYALVDLKYPASNNLSSFPPQTGYMTSFPLLFCFYPFLICAFVMSLLSLI
jgi:hypothetical protein